MTDFAKHFRADGTFQWWQTAETRYVSEGQYQLLEFLAAGGVPDEVPYVAPPPTPMPTLTSRQVRYWLVKNGISLISIDSILAGIADPVQQQLAKIDWEYATVYYRDNALVGLVTAQLGLTPAQVDAGWVAAASY